MWSERGAKRATVALEPERMMVDNGSEDSAGQFRSFRRPLLGCLEDQNDEIERGLKNRKEDNEDTHGWKGRLG